MPYSCAALPRAHGKPISRPLPGWPAIITPARTNWSPTSWRLGYCTWSETANYPIAPSYSTVNQASAACRFFYAKVLRREEAAFTVPMVKAPHGQPEMPARAELAALFAAAPLYAWTLLMTAYAAGVRVSEVCALTLADIDSQPDRMCLRVRSGKGGQERLHAAAHPAGSVARLLAGVSPPPLAVS